MVTWTPSRWSTPSAGRPIPQAKSVRGGLYGLGVSDMKGGLAAILFALGHLARHREGWAGEVAATFVGDEETMGELGSQFLLDTVPHAKADAMISADAGSPRVLRFGEKGMIWLSMHARGRSAHAAHVHRGDSAIDRLLAAIGNFDGCKTIQSLRPTLVLQAIDAASPVSEPLSGAGESDVLKSITVTISMIHGGRLPNLVADTAEATADIRLPVGVTVAEVESEIARLVAFQSGRRN